jgi:DNA ligase-1
MTLDERVQVFDFLFDTLQSTSGRLAKEQAVKIFEQTYPELIEDWTYILETLDGKHPIGWTFIPRFRSIETKRELMPYMDGIHTIKKMIRLCESAHDKTFTTTNHIEHTIGIYGDFLAPIVNRTLRLGIGKSLLEKTNITPMLAKKYEGGFLHDDFVVTEKLDGNRCVAAYNKDTLYWEFYSRSGKPMKVDFDMTGFDTDFIYDGEVMSTDQTDLSIKRYDSILNDTDFAHATFDAQLMFNRTSGLINRHGTGKKGLIYNVFDIVDDNKYTNRREVLASMDARGADVRILPTLYIGNDVNVIKSLLGRMTQMGGEGIMLNRVDRGYEHKRSDALLKYKQVQFMDMRVVNLYGGSGKYEGLVGGITCALETSDGKKIECDVGSGLSDEQRYWWAHQPSEIIGKIVQIGYHEITQKEENIGTNCYSLRFPRLIKVRTDKNSTSEY